MAEVSTLVYRGACEVFRLRTSRKQRRCDYSREGSGLARACGAIAPGQQYVHVTFFPGHDFVQTDRPQVGSCCLGCAAGYDGMEGLIPCGDRQDRQVDEAAAS